MRSEWPLSMRITEHFLPYPFYWSDISCPRLFSAPCTVNKVKKMPPEKFAQLDPVIHSRIRLAVLSILISVKEASFNYLKETIGTTDGNLSASLSKLEEARYISVKKSFKGKKPLTTCRISEKGRKAFSEYLKSLETYISFKK